MSTFTAGWYVIYTRPRHEKKVSVHLSEQGVSCYLPLRKMLKTWHDRKKFVEEPLFQSYVFVYLNGIEDYYLGKQLPGVLQYVRFGRDIARISEDTINCIKLIIENDMDVELSSDHFQQGRKLSIRQGALTGLMCEVVQWENKQRVLVRVQMLQRNLLITLPSDHFHLITA